MKKIINNKVYDTETAVKIGFSNNRYVNFAWNAETLYRKKTGEYFIYGQHKNIYTKEYEEHIMPLTYKLATEWAERNLDGDAFEKEFGAVTEDDRTETITISLPASTIARIRRKAQETGTSVSGIIGSMVSGIE